MTHPNLLRLGRSCAKWRAGILLVACLGLKCVETTAPIQIVPAVATVTLEPAAATLQVGETITLTATLRDDLGNVLRWRLVVWSSTDSAVATVQGSVRADGTAIGLVTGVGPGSVIIRASSEGKVSGPVAPLPLVVR